MLHKSGPHPNLAHRFIAVILDERNATELANRIGSGNPYPNAPQYIQPEITQNPAPLPDKSQQSRLEMLRDPDRHQRRVLSRIWTEIKLR